MDGIKKTKGFTLIECLLALAMSAALLSAVYSAARLSLKSWKWMKDRSGLYQTGRVVLETLENDLENAIPLRTYPFTGSRDSLSFVTAENLPESGNSALNVPAIQRVEYRTEAGAEKKIFRRNYQVLSPVPNASASKWKTSFPASVSDFSFSFAYGGDPRFSNALWKDDWEADQQSLPRKIRAVLVLKSTDSGETIRLVKTIHLFQGYLGP